MGTSGQMKTKVDRIKKKLAEKGPSMTAATRRLLTKKLKRFQRARRTALALEKRAEKAQGGKAEPKAAEEKPSGAGPAAAAPAG